jgi:hypothetical protein
MKIGHYCVLMVQLPFIPLRTNLRPLAGSHWGDDLVDAYLAAILMVCIALSYILIRKLST